MNERTAYLLCLLVLAGLVFLLPERWTTNARLSLLGALRPVREATAPKNPAPEATGPTMEQVLAENKLLRAQYNELVAENLRLQNQIRGKQEFGDAWIGELPRVVIADILLDRDFSSWRRSFLISRGSADGIARDDPVVRGRCVVGRVVEVSERTCRVLLLTDPAFAVVAVAVPPDPPKEGAPAREEGILRGSSEDEATLVLSRVSRRAGVQAGWLVITARDDASRWPPGLLLGTVKSVSEFGYFIGVEVAPAVDVQALDYVMVLSR
ncbi:MAG: rod shape-determining protein MreC [Planctomycetota bacterium]